jgi:hypothetical protein
MTPGTIYRLPTGRAAVVRANPDSEGDVLLKYVSSNEFVHLRPSFLQQCELLVEATA